MEEKITYNLVPIELQVEDLEDIKFPHIKDRKIEKKGQSIFFTMKDIESNIEYNAKTRKEITAKLENEKAKKENIEHFHKEVLDLTPEELHTIHMYKESCDWVDACNKQLENLDKQDIIDSDEIEAIKSQIPDFNLVEEKHD